MEKLEFSHVTQRKFVKWKGGPNIINNFISQQNTNVLVIHIIFFKHLCGLGRGGESGFEVNFPDCATGSAPRHYKNLQLSQNLNYH